MTGARATPWRAELGRKAIHLGSLVFPLAWASGVVDRSLLLVALGASLGVAIALEVLRRRSRAVAAGFDRLFGWMLREHETHGLTGATWILGAMLLAVLVLPARAALCALWAAVLGDAMAALVGRAYADGRARRAARSGIPAPAPGKTLAGSAACLLASAVGPWWLAGASVPVAALIGLAAAVAERPALALDDNARVALAAGLAAWGLGVA